MVAHKNAFAEEAFIAVGENIYDFILNEMFWGSFPEIRGYGAGIPLEDILGIANAHETEIPLTPEEAKKTVVFTLLCETEISQERKREILLTIAERFFQFKAIGKIEPAEKPEKSERGQ